jgi:hypothetical protein
MSAVRDRLRKVTVDALAPGIDAHEHLSVDLIDDLDKPAGYVEERQLAPTKAS